MNRIQKFVKNEKNIRRLNTWCLPSLMLKILTAFIA